MLLRLSRSSRKIMMFLPQDKNMTKSPQVKKIPAGENKCEKIPASLRGFSTTKLCICPQFVSTTQYFIFFHVYDKKMTITKICSK